MEKKGVGSWMKLGETLQRTQEKQRPRWGKRAAGGLRGWALALLLPLSGAAVAVARANPQLVERLYSQGLYPVLARAIGGLTSLVPFSVWEGLLVLLAAGGVALLVCLAVSPWRRRLLSRKFFRVKPLAWVRRGCGLAGVVAFLFVFLCGLNYYRLPFTAFSGLTVRESSLQELAALYLELAEEANSLRPLVAEDAQGVMVLEGAFPQVAGQARQAISALSERYAVLPDLPLNPKPVANSWLMSRAQLTGQFTFTYEANINILAPDYTIPATICHELAHTRGFMREDEANFIAYLACLESQVPQVRYSGTMLALVHVDNRLYTADPQLLSQLSQTLSPGVRRDFADHNAYWAQFENQVIAQVSEVVNDTYLKVNNQQDGTQSYGRMVDLLLADFRQRHGLE